jgi:hypothetical protein
LDEAQFEEISLEMQIIHKSMKNMLEYIFATSPLLALSTTGWSRYISGAYLLRVSHPYNVFVELLTPLVDLTAFHRSW